MPFKIQQKKFSEWFYSIFLFAGVGWSAEDLLCQKEQDTQLFV